ncbi:MAG: hypothetical protein ABI041_06845, partial [Bdellovibrionia bacterium]
MTDSKHSSSVSDLSDRVRARLRNPNYLVNYDQIHENQFGYTPDLFLPKWSIPVRIAVSTLGIVSLVFSTRTKGSVRKGLELFGLSSLIRGITNLHVTDLIGWVANPSVRLRRNIRIQAAID